MKTHQQIDARSLSMAQAVVRKIDNDPAQRGLAKARSVCARWASKGDVPGVAEWSRILELPWSDIRMRLLDESEEGQRLRQNSPFCGILSPRERADIYRGYRNHETSRP
jgi:hypothetical protein